MGAGHQIAHRKATRNSAKRTWNLRRKGNDRFDPMEKVAKPQTDVAKEGMQLRIRCRFIFSDCDCCKEYGDPKSFSAVRTSQGIIKLVDMAMMRMTGHGGQPILQLKTVSVEADTHNACLYHLLKIEQS